MTISRFHDYSVHSSRATPKHPLIAITFPLKMKASSHFLVQLALFCMLASAYLVDPPTTANPNTVSDCSWWIVAKSTDTCAAIASASYISVSDFELVYVCNTYSPSNQVLRCH